MERETGFEPATSTLARSHSTTELFPLARTLTVPHGRARVQPADAPALSRCRSYGRVRTGAGSLPARARAPAAGARLQRLLQDLDSLAVPQPPFSVDLESRTITVTSGHLRTFRQGDWSRGRMRHCDGVTFRPERPPAADPARARSLRNANRAQDFRRFLRRRRVDVEPAPPLEPGDARDARHQLDVPVKERRRVLRERRAVDDQVVRRRARARGSMPRQRPTSASAPGSRTRAAAPPRTATRGCAAAATSRTAPATRTAPAPRCRRSRE